MVSNWKCNSWSFGPSTTTQLFSCIYQSLRSQYGISNLGRKGDFVPSNESYTWEFAHFYFGLGFTGLNSNFYPGSFTLCCTRIWICVLFHTAMNIFYFGGCYPFSGLRDQNSSFKGYFVNCNTHVLDWGLCFFGAHGIKLKHFQFLLPVLRSNEPHSPIFLKFCARQDVSRP
jgi:hypothetical protein